MDDEQNKVFYSLRHGWWVDIDVDVSISKFGHFPDRLPSQLSRRYEGMVQSLLEKLYLTLKPLQLLNRSQNLHNWLFLLPPRHHLHKSNLLIAVKRIFDGLQGTGFVVLDYLLLIQRFHVVLDDIIELRKGGGFVSLISAAGDGEDVEQTGPVAFDLRFYQWAVEGDYLWAWQVYHQLLWAFELNHFVVSHLKDFSCEVIVILEGFAG